MTTLLPYLLMMHSLLRPYYIPTTSQLGMVGGSAPKWVRLAPNGTNPGLYQIRFQYIWLPSLVSIQLSLKEICQDEAGMSELGPNETNLGFLKICFQ